MYKSLARGGGGGEAREASQTKNRDEPLFFSAPLPTLSSLSFCVSFQFSRNERSNIEACEQSTYETHKSFRKIGPSENNFAVNCF